MRQKLSLKAARTLGWVTKSQMPPTPKEEDFRKRALKGISTMMLR